MSEVETTDDESTQGPVEYVPEALDLQPGMEAFSDVFARFQLPSEGDVVSQNSSWEGVVLSIVGSGRRWIQARRDLFG
jgi:hypothetical protein